ncbi:multidrug ABC transporter ATP-binding protein [Corynebacterium sp. HMSC06D04]|uniref:ABC transporter ATP-binding protein n=1 Tax=Corynebacterium TaxID=1716 RepID=UPI0008A5DE95|nr:MULTISPECIES: ABC transporter ATP-binding protein [Corynebacterium]MDK7139863.1 ABC transporter ATP-binding protein [Corynebacterium simulans]OFT52205.1 multidrug ABC transporter ATP-binding protein [Corynebacterium sp. HMSC06D04]
MANTESTLRVESLTKSFGEVCAVKDLSFSIERGEVVALLGPNGAGKTSTIDLTLGLSKPDSGNIEVCGTTPRNAVVLGRVSAMMQSGGLLPNLKVRETVELMASFHRDSLSAEEALERAGAGEFAERYVGKCSGGQQQKLRFAMALVSKPDLIVLDEPTAGVDVEARRDFWANIREDAREGRTVIFATHYLEEADDFADRIVMMNHGVLVADGSPQELRAQVSGKTIHAKLQASQSEVEQALRDFPQISLDMRREEFVLVAEDTDKIARLLLTRGLARDISITARSLDDAFIDLAHQER